MPVATNAQVKSSNILHNVN